MTQSKKYYKKRNKTLKQFKLESSTENPIHSQDRECLTLFRWSRLRKIPSCGVCTYKETRLTRINIDKTKYVMP